MTHNATWFHQKQRMTRERSISSLNVDVEVSYAWSCIKPIFHPQSFPFNQLFTSKQTPFNIFQRSTSLRDFQITYRVIPNYSSVWSESSLTSVRKQCLDFVCVRSTRHIRKNSPNNEAKISTTFDRLLSLNMVAISAIYLRYSALVTY